jgi:hypothetical protein
VVLVDVPVELQRVLFQIGVAVAFDTAGIEAITLGDFLASVTSAML